jgi:predicted homoserine dehydrogenase-like protein
LIGLELNISILSAGLRGLPTGCTQDFCGDVVATAKRDLKRGEILDGEGGSTVWGKLIPAKTSLKKRYFPIGLAQGVALKRSLKMGSVVGWDDIIFDPNDDTILVRQSMEKHFSEKWYSSF